jgi:hypothetical protein
MSSWVIIRDARRGCIASLISSPSCLCALGQWWDPSPAVEHGAVGVAPCQAAQTDAEELEDDDPFAAVSDLLCPVG